MSKGYSRVAAQKKEGLFSGFASTFMRMIARRDPNSKAYQHAERRRTTSKEAVVDEYSLYSQTAKKEAASELRVLSFKKQVRNKNKDYLTKVETRLKIKIDDLSQNIDALSFKKKLTNTEKMLLKQYKEDKQELKKKLEVVTDLLSEGQKKRA